MVFGPLTGWTAFPERPGPRTPTTSAYRGRVSGSLPVSGRPRFLSNRNDADSRGFRATSRRRRICNGPDRPLLSVQHRRPRAGSAAPKSRGQQGKLVAISVPQTFPMGRRRA